MDTNKFIWKGQLYNLEKFKQLEWDDKKYMISKYTDNNRKICILISPEDNKLLSFLLCGNKLMIYIYSIADDDLLASNLLTLNIEHLLIEATLNVDLLVPYINRIESTFDDMKEQIAELFKQGRQTKRAV